MENKEGYTLIPLEGSYLNISGKEYNYYFQVYKLEDYNFETNLKFSKNEQPGVYIFTKRQVVNSQVDIIRVGGLAKWVESAEHQLLYCGRTEDLNTRFVEHHKDEKLIKANFNSICILCCKTVSATEEIENDLLAKHNFKLNELLNKWKLNFKESVSEIKIEPIEKIK